MNNKLFIDFCKDHLPLSLFYFGAVIVILTFLNLELKEDIDFYYCLLLASFLFLVLLLIKAINYIKFYQILRQIQSGIHPDQLSYLGLTKQQQLVLGTIEKLKRKSLYKEHELQIRNDEKHKVISQIIHNIKTPASVIDLAVQNSKEGEINVTSLLNLIYKENKIIVENLDQVLSFLRLDQFQHDYIIEKIDLLSQVREKINQKKESFIYHNVFPKLTMDSEHVTVLTDKKWNGILLDQIIANAIKYTAVTGKDGVIHFHISKEENKIKLIIEDSGIGIPTFDLKRVFEPFFTGENGRKVKSASGIGLYICKRIADELNHRIQITSEVGKGTKVIITYLTNL